MKDHLASILYAAECEAGDKVKLMKISMIMAMDNAKLIGKDGDMPWKISNDLKYFKQVTMGKPMIMGRVTFDSLGKPVPGRPHIVLTRDQNWQYENVESVQSLEDAFSAARRHDGDEMMVIGGASLCKIAMPHVQCLYLTVIDHLFDNGDTWLDSFNWDDWSEVSAKPSDETAEGGFRYIHYVLEPRK